MEDAKRDKRFSNQMIHLYLLVHFFFIVSLVSLNWIIMTKRMLVGVLFRKASY